MGWGGDEQVELPQDLVGYICQQKPVVQSGLTEFDLQPQALIEAPLVDLSVGPKGMA